MKIAAVKPQSYAYDHFQDLVPPPGNNAIHRDMLKSLRENMSVMSHGFDSWAFVPSILTLPVTGDFLPGNACIAQCLDNFHGDRSRIGASPRFVWRWAIDGSGRLCYRIILMLPETDPDDVYSHIRVLKECWAEALEINNAEQFVFHGNLADAPRFGGWSSTPKSSIYPTCFEFAQVPPDIPGLNGNPWGGTSVFFAQPIARRTFP